MRRWTFFLSLTIFLLLGQGSSGQTTQDTLTSKDIAHINIGLALGKSSIGPMAEGLLNIQISKRKIIFLVRYIWTKNGMQSNETWFNRTRPFPDEQISDIAFCGGIYHLWKLKKKERIYAHFTGGLSFINGVKRGQFLYTKYEHDINIGAWAGQPVDSFPTYKVYEKINFNTIGFIIDTRVGVLISKNIGSYINLMTNANSQKSYWGWTIGLTYRFAINKNNI